MFISPARLSVLSLRVLTHLNSGSLIVFTLRISESRKLNTVILRTVDTEPSLSFLVRWAAAGTDRLILSRCE